MILAPARVQPASARIRYPNRPKCTFHRVSEPVCGSLPIFDFTKPGKPAPPIIDDASACGMSESDQLLRRQLIVGQHQIADPEQFAAACAVVGLIA